MKRIMPILALITLFTIFNCSKTEEGSGGFIVQNYIGTVSIQGTGASRLPEIGSPVSEGDTVITGSQSTIDLVYNETALLRINENTTVRIDSLMARIKNTMEIALEKGTVYTAVEKLKSDENFRISTKTMVAAVRGTNFRVSADENSSETDVLTGTVKVNPVQDGRVVSDISNEVRENNSAEIKKEQIGEILKSRKLAVAPIRAERMKRFRDDLNGIDHAVIDRLNPRLRKEFRMNILQMKQDQFEKMETQRQERMQKFIQMKKDRGARIQERFMEKEARQQERESLREEQKEKRKDLLEERKEKQEAFREERKEKREAFLKERKEKKEAFLKERKDKREARLEKKRNDKIDKPAPVREKKPVPGRKGAKPAKEK
jgi:hypothetical protein